MKNYPIQDVSLVEKFLTVREGIVKTAQSLLNIKRQFVRAAVRNLNTIPVVHREHIVIHVRKIPKKI